MVPRAPSALEAFAVLLSATEDDLHDADEAIKQLASRVLEAYERKQDQGQSEEVLAAVLRLLRAPRDDELLVLLLRILRVLHKQMRWAASASSEVAPELVRTLFSDRISTNGTAITILVALLTEITTFKPEPSAAVQDVLTKCVTKLRSDKLCDPTHWKHLDRLQLDCAFPVVAWILRDGTLKEQELMLKTLLTNPLTIRARIVMLHQGAELMLELIERASSQEVSEVRDLALVFAKDLATQIPKCRMHMLNVWLQQEQNTSLLIAENIFLRAIATEEEATFVGEALLETLKNGSNDSKLLALHSLEDNDTLVVHLCEHHDLLGVLKQSPGQDRANCGVAMGIKARIRMLLLNLLERQPRVPQLSPTVAVSISSFVDVALRKLDCEKRPLMREESDAIKSSLLQCRRGAGVRDGRCDMEKLLTIKFLHTALELNVLDPARCEVSTDASAVINAIIAERLDGVVFIANHGPAEAEQLARRILTLVARGDDVKG